MRALQRELTTACHTCTYLLLSRPVGAGGGRHSVSRKRCQLSTISQEFYRHRAPHSDRLLHTYVESGGGGGGGNTGGPSTTFDDGHNSQPWSQYSLFGITVLLVSLMVKVHVAVNLLHAEMINIVEQERQVLFAGSLKLPTAQ